MTVALVTGGHGFVGSSLRPLLRERRYEVVALGRRSRAPGAQERYLRFDLASPDGLAEAIDAIRPDVVFHLAASAGQNARTLDALVTDTVIGTHALCTAIRRTGLRTRVILAGSSAQYGNIPPAENPITEETRCWPANAYGFAKVAAEATACALAADDTFEVIPARAFNVIGPDQPRWTVAGSFAHRVSDVVTGRAARIEVTDLEVVRDFTDVRDIARGFIALAEQGVPRRVYNLCSGRRATVADVLDGLLTAAGLDRGIVDVVPSTGHGVPYQVGSPDRIYRDTGWAASISLSQSLGDLLRSVPSGASDRNEEDRF